MDLAALMLHQKVMIWQTSELISHNISFLVLESHLPHRIVIFWFNITK